MWRRNRGGTSSLLLNKADAVCPPELHQVVGPYLNTIEERLNPNFQPHGQDLQQTWQNQVKPNMPQLPWSQQQGSTQSADLAGVSAVATQPATGVAFDASEPAQLAKCSNGPAEDG